MKRRRRAREYGAPGDFTLTQLIRQHEAQGSVCAYCSHPVNGIPDPDHVLPISRGGRNDMSNIVASCRACSTDKSDLTLPEWAADRARRNLEPRLTELDGPAFINLWLREPNASAWRDRTNVRLAA